MSSSLPYVPSHGQVTKVLEKIRSASTPTRFTQDFLATKLDMKGGHARPVIPFLKRTGFLGSDGVPTELYKRYRNSASSGAAAAEALQIGYSPLYEINEYVHDAKDQELRGLIIQVTGSEPDSRVVQSIAGSFKALRAMADFSGAEMPSGEPEEAAGPEREQPLTVPSSLGQLNLGYTINLHLPATSDVAVFNAIFKSLREHLIA